MSRVHLHPKNPEHKVVVGLDHVLGWFCQLFTGEDEEGEDIVEIDKCNMFDRGFGQSKLIEFIRTYATNDDITQLVVYYISMDMDPGPVAKQRKQFYER